METHVDCFDVVVLTVDLEVDGSLQDDVRVFRLLEHLDLHTVVPTVPHLHTLHTQARVANGNHATTANTTQAVIYYQGVRFSVHYLA
jgi:hypothetical protein